MVVVSSPCISSISGEDFTLPSLEDVGIELFSRAASRKVFSPLQSLTSVFGMGTGGPSALESPTVRLRGVLALSYLPGPSPDKYFRHCRA